MLECIMGAHVKSLGYTLVEVLITVVVLGILAGIAYVGYGAVVENNQRSAADNDLTAIANATKLYATEYNQYPPDVSRNIPPEVKEFIDSQDTDDWPDAPWPGSVFDYDNWTINGEPTIQISIRFCPAGGPLSACKFPKESWASNFGVNSAYYYCIKGNCRSHNSEAATYPGYCVNCPGNKAIGT